MSSMESVDKLTRFVNTMMSHGLGENDVMEVKITIKGENPGGLYLPSVTLDSSMKEYRENREKQFKKDQGGED